MADKSGRPNTLEDGSHFMSIYTVSPSIFAVLRLQVSLKNGTHKMIDGFWKVGDIIRTHGYIPFPALNFHTKSIPSGPAIRSSSSSSARSESGLSNNLGRTNVNRRLSRLPFAIFSKSASHPRSLYLSCLTVKPFPKRPKPVFSIVYLSLARNSFACIAFWKMISANPV
ncbi:hypothetical protein I7I53_04895 [Histoplasma capsulatum var. duboisii H88]|uniref:Uncharacterized protein n=1 Tax=Ajellomyces capsulatus (strain H88) TaxID=544711 RepID=A0A8A1LXH7_AJEC8|nr:hypothetical protein I7I53_04895 [Histoplasma capsulatum var. duboisii H88]